MSPPAYFLKEQAYQLELLLSDTGSGVDGTARYAAAMYFYNLDMLPADILEIYRRCSRLDNEDPIEVAKYEGLRLPRILTDQGLEGTQ